MNKFLGGVVALGLVIGLAWYFLYTEAIPGHWTLVTEESSFHFSSTKNGDFTEEHSIKNIEGSADYSGDFMIRLDLASVETGVEIRNQRMRDFLFETAQYPVARIEGKFKLVEVAELQTGDEEVIPVKFTLTLHGVQKDMEVKVSILRREWRKVVLTPVQDIVIHAADFNLDGGIEKLRELAGLDTISHDVPITFKLTFKGDSNLKVD